MDVDEVWAYREKQGARLVEARVAAVGKKKPLRVRVILLDDEHEGTSEWVPASRLKVLWRDRESYVEREDRWSTLIGTEPVPSAERDAAMIVFEMTVKPDIMEIEGNGSSGVGAIYDVDGLCAIVGWAPEQLTKSPNAFVEDSTLFVGWDATRALAIELARSHPRPILDWVRESELEHEAWLRGWVAENVHLNWDSTEAELIKGYQLKYPFDVDEIRVIREWLGEPAVSMHAELEELWKQFQVLALLAAEAAPEIRRLGTQRANRLALQLERAARREARPPDRW